MAGKKERTLNEAKLNKALKVGLAGLQLTFFKSLFDKFLKNFCSNEWFFRFFQLSHIKRFVKLSCRQFQHLQFAGIFFTLLFLKVIPHLFRLTQKEKKGKKVSERDI